MLLTQQHLKKVFINLMNLPQMNRTSLKLIHCIVYYSDILAKYFLYPFPHSFKQPIFHEFKHGALVVDVEISVLNYTQQESSAVHVVLWWCHLLLLTCSGALYCTRCAMMVPPIVTTSSGALYCARCIPMAWHLTKAMAASSLQNSSKTITPSSMLLSSILQDKTIK